MPTKSKARKKRGVKIVLIAIIIVAAWIIAAPYLATYLIVEKPLANADAIIVLSGSAVYQERTRKAAELYKQGIAPLIFVTNDAARAGWSEADHANPPFVDLERRELIANGVPPDAIKLLDGEVLGTNQEANVLAAEIDARPLRSVLIVTSAYHSRRALWIFNKTLAGKGVDVGIEHAPTGDRTPTPGTWWLKPRGWPMVAGEYVKFVGYWMFY